MSEELCTIVLAGLEQFEIFRAAMACAALCAAAATPRLYRQLDLRVVGRTVGMTGRLRCLSHEANVFALGEFLGQKRFSQATELNVSGLYLGNFKPEENHILNEAARRCPNVGALRLGMVEPRRLWSDLGRYLPTAFERSLRSWWATRPFVVEAYGRRYDLT